MKNGSQTRSHENVTQFMIGVSTSLSKQRNMKWSSRSMKELLIYRLPKLGGRGAFLLAPKFRSWCLFLWGDSCMTDTFKNPLLSWYFFIFCLSYWWSISSTWGRKQPLHDNNQLLELFSASVKMMSKTSFLKGGEFVLKGGEFVSSVSTIDSYPQEDQVRLITLPSRWI